MVELVFFKFPFAVYLLSVFYRNSMCVKCFKIYIEVYGIREPRQTSKLDFASIPER